jgi:preprotein translocase subunit SecG
MSPEEQEQMKAHIGEEVSKNTAKKVGKVVGTVGAIFAGVFFAIFLGFLFGWVIQWLWNFTLVDMFDWPKITYWQAVCVFILAKIFFGFGHSGGHPKHKHKRKNNDEEHKEQVREGWQGRSGAFADNQTSLAKDEMFRKYWQAEGKAAYEAYLAGDRESAQSEPK